jgi:hypothetical protein
LIPDIYNPQTWNRYSYVNNRPIIFNDPTGHCPQCVAVAPLTIPPLVIAGLVVATALIVCNAISPCHNAMVDGISNALDTLERWQRNSANKKQEQSINESLQKTGYDALIPGFNPKPKKPSCGFICILIRLGSGVGIGLVACVEIWDEQCSQALTYHHPTPLPAATTLTPTPTIVPSSSQNCPPHIVCPLTSTPSPEDNPTSPISPSIPNSTPIYPNPSNLNREPIPL